MPERDGSKMDSRIAHAEGQMQAAYQSRDKAERGRKAAQADNARLRAALAEMTAERDALAAQLGAAEPEPCHSCDATVCTDRAMCCDGCTHWDFDLTPPARWKDD